MKIEEIIRQEEAEIEFLKTRNNKEFEPLIDRCQTIIAALEKQISKEPITKGNQYWCPDCASHLTTNHGYIQHKRCDECGQLIKRD